jgi:hypothetical protein
MSFLVTSAPQKPVAAKFGIARAIAGDEMLYGK